MDELITGPIRGLTPWRSGLTMLIKCVSKNTLGLLFRLCSVLCRYRKVCFDMMCPEEFFETVNAFVDIRAGSDSEKKLTEFIQNSSARELEQALILCLRITTNYNARWIQQAATSLSLRIAEQAAGSTNKLIQHTEKLTQQTDIQIQHSAKLTDQTSILISESRKVRCLTWGLLLLTAILLILTIGLLIAGCRKETHTVHVITNLIMVSNKPVAILITNLLPPKLTTVQQLSIKKDPKRVYA